MPVYDGVAFVHDDSASLALARFLAEHPRVAAVNYPGLPEAGSHAVARQQFGARFGGLLTFDLADGDDLIEDLERGFNHHA